MRKKTTKKSRWSMILSRIRSAETNGMQLHEVRTKLDIKFLSFVQRVFCYRFMVHDQHESSILTATSNAWPTLWAQNVPAKCNRRQLHEVRTKLDIKFLSFVQRVFCYRFMDYRILAVSVVPKQGQLCRCIIKGKRQF